MNEAIRIYRFEVFFDPLLALHELEPDTADNELLALGGSRHLMIAARGLKAAEKTAEATITALRPLELFRDISVTWEHCPLSAHEEMALRGSRRKLDADQTWWPDGAPA